jgi:hypothetical protein
MLNLFKYLVATAMICSIAFFGYHLLLDGQRS